MGYSSLAALKEYEIDILKITRSFMKFVDQSAGASQVISAIIEMAHAMNIEVVCEGVETAQQMELVRRLGADYYQGFYFSKPIPAADFDALLHQPDQKVSVNF